MRLDNEYTGNALDLVPETHGMDVPSACVRVKHQVRKKIWNEIKKEQQSNVLNLLLTVQHLKYEHDDN